MTTYLVTLLARCSCGWEYGPALQTDTFTMARFHLHKQDANQEGGVRHAHKMRYTAKCDCGWYLHDANGSQARKAAADHRAGRDEKEAVS